MEYINEINEIHDDHRVVDFIRSVLSGVAKTFDENPDLVKDIIKRDFVGKLKDFTLSAYRDGGVREVMRFLISELIEVGVDTLRIKGIEGKTPLIRDDIIRGILKDEELLTTLNVYNDISEDTIKMEYNISLHRFVDEENTVPVLEATVLIDNEDALAGLNAGMNVLRDEFAFSSYVIIDDERVDFDMSDFIYRYSVNDVNDKMETFGSVYTVKIGEHYYKFNTAYFMQGVLTASNWTGVPAEEIYSDLRLANDGTEIIVG